MISYNYTTKEISVSASNSLRTVYSDSMNVFAQAAQMDDLIPLRADTPTLFTLINGWVFSTASIAFLHSAALQDATGNNVWTNVQTIGSIVAGTILYIEQNGAVAWTAPSPGHINILLRTRQNGTNIDNQFFRVYARLFQQEYSSFSATGGPIVAPIALSTKVDAQLDIAQSVIDAYTGMSITWGAITRDINNGNGSRNYNILINGGGRTLKEVYNWVQRQLLRSTDIDSGAGTSIGQLTSPLVSFTGTMITGQGVFVENFAAADANRITYTDSTGTLQSPPLTVPITITASPAMNGGRAVVYQLAAPYDPATYTPASITATLLSAEITGGVASTSMIYTADRHVVVRTRRAGLRPFEVGTTLTSSGLSVASINEVDTVYIP